MSIESHKKRFVIAQISDIHCGEKRFDAELMERTIEDVNELSPDLVVIPGDLTASGYLDEFEEAKSYIDKLEIEDVIVIAGNHDCRNVGWVHFEKIFGDRYHSVTFPFMTDEEKGCVEKIKVVAIDSNRPDVNEGEIGRGHYKWIIDEFADECAYRLFVLHHHLIGIPHTGRERGVCLDGGDVLWTLGRAQVDLIMNGHKHVPWVWTGRNSLIVTSGTATTGRLRGDIPASYNVVRIGKDDVEVTYRSLSTMTDTIQTFDRRPRQRTIKTVRPML